MFDYEDNLFFILLTIGNYPKVKWCAPCSNKIQLARQSLYV